MIEFESVSKTFRDGTTAVDNLNLVVPSGRITVIVGPSGCGKTTTLRMVNRMLEPSKGKITWDGKPVKSRRKTTLRRQMGYVIQSGGLFPHRTVLENIATVPDLLRWDKQKSRKRAVELLSSVGLDRKLGQRYPAQLSGGQQQRVGVARALAADPLVLLMDEPFSAVDPVVRAELHEFFLDLQRQLSKTIIMITHDIDEAIKLGDQVAILRVGGRLAQVGTPQQLLDEPADAFVEGFVGKDRGYRSLSFQSASGLSLGNVQVVRDAASASGEGPVLVVDADARPVGWADPSRPGAVMALGATFDPETDSLRAALDAALTSPVGLAVAVTSEPRRYAGVVDADMILHQVTQTRAQIAESIAVRSGSQPAAPYAQPGRLPADQPMSPDEDPDATSVRSVPPVPTVGSVGAVAAASSVGFADDDPDATRISGPLPSEDIDSDATRLAGPLPDHDDSAGDDVGYGPGSAGDRDPETAGFGHDPYAPVAHAPQSRPAAWDGSEPYGAESYGAEPYGAEPYGAEAPSTEDETVATAYDAQLAHDDVLAERQWHSAEDASTIEHDQPVDQPETVEQPPQPADQPETADEPQSVEQQPQSADQPENLEQPDNLDQPAPADSDDHDREWPR